MMMMRMMHMQRRQNAVVVVALIFSLACAHAARGAGAATTAELEEVRDRVDAYFEGEGAGLLLSRIADLCDRFGPRPAGSARIEAAIDAQAEELRAEGFNVTLQEVMVPHWVRGSESLTLLSPRVANETTPIAVIGLGYSGATPPGGIEAPLFIVPSLPALEALLEADADAVRGRIVLINERYEVGGYGATVGTRYAAPRVVKDAGGLAALVRSVGPFGIRSPHTGATTRGVNLPAGSIAISDAMRLQRLYDTATPDEPLILRLVFDGHEDKGEVMSRNIIADWEGSTLPDEFVLLSGHFDSWDNTVGAMDDLGGAFLAWSAISALRSLGLRPARTVRAVLWADEEVGALGAASFWSQAVADGSTSKYTMAFESDSGVFEPRGIGLSANAEATNLVRSIVVDVLGKEVHSTVGSGGSDIAPAQQWAAVPTGNLRSDTVKCWTPEGSINTPDESNPTGHFQGDYFFYHHSVGDTPEVLDRGQLDRAAAMWTVVAFGVADLPELLPRIDTSADMKMCAESCADESACLTNCLSDRILPAVRREHLNTGVFPAQASGSAQTGGDDDDSESAEESPSEAGAGGAEDTLAATPTRRITFLGIFIGILVSAFALAAFLITVGLTSREMSIGLGIVYVNVSSEPTKSARSGDEEYSMLDLQNETQD